MGCESSHAYNNFQHTSHTHISEQRVLELIKLGQYEQVQRVGDLLFEDEKYHEAIHIYQKIIEGNINKDYQPLGLGNLQQLNGLVTSKFYDYYQKMFKSSDKRKNPYDALSLCYAAIKVRREEQIQKGIKWYQQQILKVQNYQIYIGYAHLLNNRFQFDQALNVYQKVINLKQTMVNIYISVAFIRWFHRKQSQTSVLMLNKILLLDPSNMYAKFLLNKNQKEGKVEKLRLLDSEFPSYIRILNEIGLFQASNKKYAKAIEYYSQCIKILPQYIIPYYNIALSLFYQSQFKQSIQWFLNAFSIDNNFHPSFRHIANLFTQMKYTDDQIKQQRLKYPTINELQYYYNIGIGYYQIKNYFASIKWYKIAKSIRQDYKIYNSLGISYDFLLKDEQAIKCYKKAIELNPKNCLPYYNLAIHFKKLKNMQESISNYKKSLSLNPKFVEAHNNLGNIYKQKSLYEDAIPCYKNAIKYNSTNALAYTNMMICEDKRNGKLKAFHAFSKAKGEMPRYNNRLEQRHKSYISRSVQKFRQSWSKMDRMTLQPFFKEKEVLIFNQDDQININYLANTYPSLQQNPYRRIL